MQCLWSTIKRSTIKMQKKNKTKCIDRFMKLSSFYGPVDKEFFCTLKYIWPLIIGTSVPLNLLFTWYYHSAEKSHLLVFLVILFHLWLQLSLWPNSPSPDCVCYVSKDMKWGYGKYCSTLSCPSVSVFQALDYGSSFRGGLEF